MRETRKWPGLRWSTSSDGLKTKIGKNGIVTEEEYHDEAIKKIINFCKESSYKLLGIEDSPIRGARGNKEFLALIKLTNNQLKEEEWKKIKNYI